MRVAFNAEGALKPQIGVYSFGARFKEIPKAQFEFDVSKLRDPQGQKQFAGAAGWDPAVRDWVKADPRIAGIINDCRLWAEDLLKERPQGGTNPSAISCWTSFSFRDFHGKWAAPAVAELVADALSKDGWRVSVHHYGQSLNARKETTRGGRISGRL